MGQEKNHRSESPRPMGAGSDGWHEEMLEPLCWVTIEVAGTTPRYLAVATSMRAFFLSRKRAKEENHYHYFTAAAAEMA